MKNSEDQTIESIPIIETTPIIDEESLLLAEREDESVMGLFKIFRKLSGLSLPIALSFTFSIEMFLIALMINMSSDDDDEVASATLIVTIINTLVIMGMSPLFAMNITASKKIGELQKAEEDRVDEDELKQMREYIAGVNRNGNYIAAGITPPIMAGLIFSKPLLTEVFGQNEHVASLASDFLKVYSIAVPGLMSRIVSEQMMFSFEKPTAAMGLGLGSLAVGSGVALVLQKGWLGLPEMGPRGIATGFVLEAYMTAVAYGAYLAISPSLKNFHFFKLYKPFKKQLSQLWELAKNGSAISFTMATELAMALSLGILSGLLGPEQQSAMTCVNQYILFNFLLSVAFGQGTSQELNRLTGAKDIKNAKRMGVAGLVISTLYNVPIPLFFSVFPGLLVTSGQANANNIKSMLRILAPIISIGNMADAVRYNLLQQLRVLGSLKSSTAITMTTLLLGIALSAVLAFCTDLDIVGVGIGYAASNIFASLFLLVPWLRDIYKLDVPQEDEDEQNVNELEDSKEKGSNLLSCSLFCCKRSKNEDSDLDTSNDKNGLFQAINSDVVNPL